MRTLRFTLPVTPRTKKTSNRIVGMGAKCRECGKQKIQRVLPSETFEEFEREALMKGATIIPALKSKGAQLPITVPVHIKALVYRESDTGDWTGFVNALADVLQGERYTVQCPKCSRGRKLGADVIQQGRFAVECLGCHFSWRASA